MELSSPVSVPTVQHSSSTTRLMETQSSRNEDWNTVQRSVLSLFQQKAIGTTGPIDLYLLNQKLLNLMKTEISPFLGAYYQEQLLKRGMIVMREAVREEVGQSLLDRLGEVWQRFFGSILPSLQAIFYPLMPSQTSSGMSIRNMSLLGFRDIILMKMPVKEAVETPGVVVPPAIKQMLLILSLVREKDHPTETYLRLEDTLACVVSPFIPAARTLKRCQEERCKDSPRMDKASGSRTLPRNLSSTAVKERAMARDAETDHQSSAAGALQTPLQNQHLRGKTFSAHGERGSFPLSAEQQSLRRGQPAMRRRPPSTKSSTAALVSDLGPLQELRPPTDTLYTAGSAPDLVSQGREPPTPPQQGQQKQRQRSAEPAGSSGSSGEGSFPAPVSAAAATTSVTTAGLSSSVQSTGSGGSGPDPRTPASLAMASSPDIASVDESTLDGGEVV